VGPPGAGKSRLAAEFSARFAGFEDLWFVDLTAVEQIENVAVTVAAAAAIALTAANSEEQLVTALASHPKALLVLDNLEHLGPHMSGLIGKWLSECDGLSVLCTSRGRLQEQGEQLLELGCLDLPDQSTAADDLLTLSSVRLFAARAKAVRAGLDWENLDHDTVREIVQLTEGLPLPLELAAARLRLFDVKTLLSRLRESLAVLQGGGNDVARNAVSWSWKLLAADEQRMLRTVSIFSDGFTVDAVEAVTETWGAGRTLNLLQVLRDQSLLRLRSDGRLEVFGLVRDFAVNQDGTDDIELLFRRHADYFHEQAKERARDIRETGSLQALVWIRDEWANLEAVVTRAHSRGDDNPDWWPMAVEAGEAMAERASLFGPIPRTAELLDGLLRRVSKTGAERARLSILLAKLNRFLGRLGVAQDLLDNTESMLPGQDDSQLVGTFYATSAAVSVVKGDFERANHLVTKAGEYLKETQAGALQHALLNGWTLRCVGEFEASVAVSEEAVYLCRELGNNLILGNILITLASANDRLGRPRAAAEHAQEAVDLFRASENPRLGWALGSLAEYFYHQGQLEETKVALLEAAAECERLGSRMSLCWCLRCLSEVAMEMGDEDLSRRSFERAVGMTPKNLMGVQADLAITRAHRAWHAGDYPAAQRSLESLMEMPHIKGVASNERFCLAQLQAVAAVTGRLDEAKALREDVSAIPVQAEHDPLELATKVYLAFGHVPSVAPEQGNQDASEEAGQKIMETILWAYSDTHGMPAPAKRSYFVRFATSFLVRVLPDAFRISAYLTVHDPEGTGLAVDREAGWFRPPGSEIISTGRKRLVQRLLKLLIEQKETESPPVSTQDVIDYLWPGERIIAEAAVSRVYFTVNTLRKMGIGDLIISTPEGYRLDPEVELIVVPSS